MIVSDEQENQCEHSYLPEESSHEYLIASCSVAPTHLAEITMAVVMVIEFADRESVIDCLIVDDDDDRRQHQMKLTESVDESDDVNVSAIAILIEIAIETDDDVVSVMVIVRIDVMMTMSMLTMMMLMMMMVVTARRMPAVVPSSRHLATRECPRSGCVPTRQR